MASATNRATRGINLLAITLFGSLVIMADQLTELLWGERFAGSAPILQVLLLAVMLTSCAVPCVTRLSATSTGSLALATRTSIVGVLASALLWLPLGALYGAQGIAWGYLLGAASTASTLMIVCWRRDSQRWGVMLVRTAVAFCALVWVAASGLTYSWTDAVPAAALFAVTYVASAWGEQALARRSTA